MKLKAGENIPIHLILADGDSSQSPIAIVRAPTGAQLIKIDLTHKVGGNYFGPDTPMSSQYDYVIVEYHVPGAVVKSGDKEIPKYEKTAEVFFLDRSSLKEYDERFKSVEVDLNMIKDNVIDIDEIKARLTDLREEWGLLEIPDAKDLRGFVFGRVIEEKRWPGFKVGRVENETKDIRPTWKRRKPKPRK